MSNGYSSSSDDEEFRPNAQPIQLPQHQLDLNRVRRENERRDNAKFTKATSNFAKAAKFNPKKKTQYGDSYNPKDPRFSMGSSQQSSVAGSEESDDEMEMMASGGTGASDLENLARFRFDADDIKKSTPQLGDSEDDDEGPGYFGDEAQNADYANMNPPPENFYNTESSDDGDDDEEENNDYVNDNQNPAAENLERPDSSSRRSSKASKKSRRSSESERDEVPAMRKHSIHSMHSHQSHESKNSKNSGTGGGIKSIFRKMSLADRFPSDEYNQDMSHSDTFLGRVFNIGSSGISGGGLAPGASKKTNELPEIDEEKRVGFAEKENDRDAIEMQPISLEELSEEAKALIGQHLPPGLLHSADQSMQNSSADISPSASPRPKSSERGDHDSDETMNAEADEAEQRRKSEERKKKEDPFYTPNPDMFIRGTGTGNAHHYEAGGDFLHDLDGDYIARPKQVQAGVLSSLLRLYQNPREAKSASSLTTGSSNEETPFQSTDDELSTLDEHKKAAHFAKFKHEVRSGLRRGAKAAETGVHMGYAGVRDVHKLPKHMLSKANKAYHLRDREGTNDTLLPDVEDSDDSLRAEEVDKLDGSGHLPSFHNAKPKMPKKKATDASGRMKKKLKTKQRAERLRITVHIADILQRQRFIMNMCRALMLFGAPTHRLEEYMVMTSRVLEIDGQFMYFPGCMLVSFGDAATRTSEVHLVRCAQGLNLGKLADTHKIYKAVIHDLIGVEEASKKLDELLKQTNRYPPWVCVLLYGIGSLAVTPFAFDGGWIDLPISFGVGLCVGYLQFYASSKSNLYSSVFEVSAAIVVAFIARGLGSIRSGHLFCFSAIAQGSLALILPGYIILCGSLELQSRNLVAGSVRMFYAIIYSLFLGFGITLGAALYGWVDHGATSQNSCEKHHSMDDRFRILFVPLFSTVLGLINQAKFHQLPIMIVISCTGYIGTYFAGKHFSTVTEFTACIGAFIVGILGNLYSRIWKGMAVSAMLPAIFVQVPSGIASKSTLISGLQQADQITNRNGTSTVITADDGSSLSFGATMVEVSIGISVGLFAAALVVYPFGKKRTGLFTL
ncbi:uncharacterized protein LODBEIA_P60580 [Lodderomyces beijingensis]|uniref:Threonine/serine exporter-like N-terminal domain-containing protein n=1 Tax=Lodderomyces beijingensis TaxID=1775926 RepID=A0ABP0ZUM0_9ASCO